MVQKRRGADDPLPAPRPVRFTEYSYLELLPLRAGLGGRGSAIAAQLGRRFGAAGRGP